ncbi:MAG: SGNH/GDSL hydrolase family protein [Burkholderiaceae bacterium]
MFDLTRNARVLAAAAVSLLLISCGGSDDSPAPLPLFQTTVVVGSSVVDTGNRCGLAADPLCFPTPAYAGTSTASNGPLYVQTVAARYGIPLAASSAGGFNFGIGGATTGVIPTDTVAQKIPNMQLQTEQFLQRVGFQANPQHLYIVDGAALGNNVRRVLTLVQANPALAATLPTQAVTQAATDIFNVVARLYAAGARHVVVTNSVNLGLVPAIAGSGASAIQLGTAMAAGFNGALATQVVPGLRAASPGLNLYYVDLGALSAEIAAAPANFGLTNIQAPCYPFFSAPAAPVCATPNTYLWWDELHPTAAVHAIAADRVVAAIGR